MPAAVRYTCHNKYYGRQLTPAGFRAAIRQFFDPDFSSDGDGSRNGNLRLDVLEKLLAKLKDLRRIIQVRNDL